MGASIFSIQNTIFGKAAQYTAVSTGTAQPKTIESCSEDFSLSRGRLCKGPDRTPLLLDIGFGQCYTALNSIY